MKLGATRNLNFLIGIESDSMFLDNFIALFPVLGIHQQSLDRIPDYGTLIHLMKGIDTDALANVQVLCVKRLIRNKVFEDHRLLGEYYQIAIDGTRIISFDHRHCEHCLRKKISVDEAGEPIYEYYHYMVAVCLVTKKGLCIPILTEFVENESSDIKKQDCELKAFYRLAPKLKQFFPKTKFCLLLDALFAGKPTFDLCEKFKWKFIVNFKKNIPSLDEEFRYQKAASSNKIEHYPINANSKLSCFWSNDMPYEGLLLKAIDCIETVKGVQTKYFRFLTNIPINYKNYSQIIQGGRTRWKIENEGFNTMKNGGYQLQHLYGHDYTAIKNFCALLILGFTISRFVVFTIGKSKVFKYIGAIINLFKRLFCILAERPLPDFLTKSIISQKYQIRLNFD